ncbi:MAG: DNA alkylation repair protein [Bacteroidales bacterium]|nr:DNA alkylation repair protein [Bacteroidales bacterium]MDD4217135.1 DNA alkylation repair protein [Bacteroidales bacterium]MDY0141692.1 DNA alkylation repair protein [Bacteroidales bacterium]
MTDYLTKAQHFFEKHRNMGAAVPMAKYMKNQFSFLGIPASKRKDIFRVFFNTFPIPDLDTSKIIVKELFNLPEREYHYFAIQLLTKHKKRWAPTDIIYFESLILTNSWWDTVDLISSRIIAPFFKKYPNLTGAMTDSWSASKNIWLKRVSIIFQLSYKENTNTEILTRHILDNASHSDFFIQKAIGWALREYSKTDYKWVLNFVIQSSALKPLSKREAIRWIDNKGLIE